VAVVANATTKPADVERMTARLVKNLQDAKVTAVAMESRTTMHRELQPTPENGAEAQDKQCDHILLTQIIDFNNDPLEPRGPTISVGGRVPSIDAADSGTVYRDNLQINFDLFRIGRFKPIVDGAVQEKPAVNVSDSLMPAMDREANRISHDLKKK
jgi:hypothetical protein